MCYVGRRTRARTPSARLGAIGPLPVRGTVVCGVSDHCGRAHSDAGTHLQVPSIPYTSAGIAVDHRPATGVNCARPLAYDMPYVSAKRKRSRTMLRTCGISRQASCELAKFKLSLRMPSSPRHLQSYHPAAFLSAWTKFPLQAQHTFANCIWAATQSPAISLITMCCSVEPTGT